ncbi:Protein Hook 1 [Chytridiales sp. JEL 0842]|nr:Protein Hook 1 [Chytridiales sp. JEL 0842]
MLPESGRPVARVIKGLMILGGILIRGVVCNRFTIKKTCQEASKMSLSPADKGKLDEVSLEIYESKQDIVEFLNIKVTEHEEYIANLESKVRQLEEEKKDMDMMYKSELDNTTDQWKAEVESLQLQCARYKTELEQLSDFKSRKEELEQQLRRTMNTLETKEKEFKDTIHSMERKNQMKKEMLQKVNEAVANFRRVADQQMAETTKRAIRENMAITSQLKKMSAKTLELIADNDGLTAKVNKLKISNSLLTESEKELAKKNQANQQVIKMLVERLKESDEMLEIAYEAHEGNEEVMGSMSVREMPSESLTSLPRESKNQKVFTELSQVIGFDVLDTVSLTPESLSEKLEGLKQKFIASFEEKSSTAEKTTEEVRPKRKPSPYKRKPPIPKTETHRPEIVRITKDVDITPVISAIPSSSGYVDSGEHTSKTVGVQTLPVFFGKGGFCLTETTETISKEGVSRISTLLSDVRPWGAPASCLPKKGAGLYLPNPIKTCLVVTYRVVVHCHRRPALTFQKLEMNNPDLATALVAWIKTFSGLSKPCDSISDLADGTILLEILSEIDGHWFKLARQIDTGDNWVLKFNNLKKLYKLLTGYYEEVLGQSTIALEVPNLTSIARDGDQVEILKLGQLIVALAVQCEQNQTYILKIQSLDQLSQHSLMLAIEQVMGRLAASSKAAYSSNQSEYDAGGELSFSAAQKAEMESTIAALRDQVRQLQDKYDELASEKNDLQTGLRDMEETMTELSSPGKSDFILKSEIDTLKAQLYVEESARKLEETSRLKDQLDEFRHFADKLQKSEAMIEKYKRKMEEGADFRKQVKVLEAQNNQMAERNRYLEDECRKLSSYKPMIETYKEQISMLEGQNSSLQVEKSKMEFEISETRSKVERLEMQRKSDQDQLQNLEDQLHEMELHGPVTISNELSESSLSDALSLKPRISQLERELASAKLATDEAMRNKEKFEMEYMAAFQKNISLEKELKQARSAQSSNSQELVDSLREQLTNYQVELTSTKRRLAEAELALSQGTGSLSVGATDNSAELERMKRQVDSLEKESRFQMAQINKLSFEKDALENQTMELKDAILHHERAANDMKAALAAVDSKGESPEETTQKLAAATQKIVQLTEQNNNLHKALKSAKQHILSQDKKIKDIQNAAPKENFPEALASYETKVRDLEAEIERAVREMEDTRRAAKKEQALMIAAWHHLGLLLQKRGQAPSNGTTPISWLAHHRKVSTVKGR